MLGQSYFKDHFTSAIQCHSSKTHFYHMHTSYRLVALPAGKCLLSLELCSYPWNGPLPTVSPLDSYKLQDVFASNWMSNFIATSIPLPPAANDKQEHALLLLDTRGWERNSKAPMLSPVWAQSKQRKNSHSRGPTDTIWQDRNQGQNIEFFAHLYQLCFPQPKGQKLPKSHISVAMLIAAALLRATSNISYQLQCSPSYTCA